MVRRSKMEVNKFFQENGYFYIPNLILDPEVLKCEPPHDQNGKRMVGVLKNKNGQLLLGEDQDQVDGAFARYNFKGKNKIFLSLMLARAVPGISLSLPLFILFAKLGIINTSLGVIIVYVAMNVPFTIWLTDGFFRQIPKEMSEVARTDGCTRFQAFWNVELPLAGPGIGAAAIFAFLLSWNEYALASILTRTVHSKTLPIGMMDYLDEFTINWAGMCAIAVVMIVPAVILTFIVQKHLVSGLTFGGVKG